MISNRFGRANNPYMGEAYDEIKPTKFITYLDANSLYEWAMCWSLPVGNFKWITDFDNWRNIPCILEVDLGYPKELHDLHNDYPLAPERLIINGVEKLIPNLNDKDIYIVHHNTLKQYLHLGLRIKKIHRDISFEEEPWLKNYIELNTNLRK